ncbi:MAG: tetratricopeptide repeat protein [Polyangiales bacterium]
MPESFDGPGGEDLTLARARAAEARDHLVRGAIDEAVRCIFEAVDFAPTDVRMMHEFVHSLQDHERYSDALALVERILAIEPENAAALIDLGYSLEPLGELDRAWDAYTRASTLDPTDAVALNNRAYLEMGRGNLTAALADVTEALSRDDSESIAYATRAEVLSQLGRIDEAFAALTRAIELDASWVDTAKNSEFLQAVREDPRWDRWLAENEPSFGDA